MLGRIGSLHAEVLAWHKFGPLLHYHSSPQKHKKKEANPPNTMLLHRRSLFLLFGTLLLSSYTRLGDAAERQSCGIVSNRSQLTKRLATSHVLVSLQTQEQDDLADDDAEYKELCDRYKNTPTERVQELDIVQVSDEALAKQLWEQHSKVHWFDQLSSMGRTVQQLVWKKGNDDTRSSHEEEEDAVRYILFFKDQPESGRRYLGPSLAADAVSEFVASVTKTKKLGNFVYSMHHFDFCAARFVQAISDDVMWKQAAWYNVARVLHKLQSLSDTTGTSQSLGTLYLKAMKNIQAHGINYAKHQIKRLDKILDDTDASVTELKREELSQKKYILKRFTEPVDLDSVESQQFVWYILFNGGLLLVLAVWWPLSMLFPGAEEGAEGDDDDKQEDEGDDQPQKHEDAAAKKKDE